MQKLNFGCGSIQPDGWINLDREKQFKTEKKYIEFLECKTYDMVVAHCSLQVNDFNCLPDLLGELRRVLKPGGVLRISMVDIKEGFKQYLNGNIAWFPNGEPELDLRFCAWLTWYSTSRFVLTAEALQILLLNAGFEEVKRVDFKQTALSTTEITELDTRENECYFMEAKR